MFTIYFIYYRLTNILLLLISCAIKMFFIYIRINLYTIHTFNLISLFILVLNTFIIYLFMRQCLNYIVFNFYSKLYNTIVCIFKIPMIIE